MTYTDFINIKFQKSDLKFLKYRAWSNGRSNVHNFVNFASFNLKF